MTFRFVLLSSIMGFLVALVGLGLILMIAFRPDRSPSGVFTTKPYSSNSSVGLSGSDVSPTSTLSDTEVHTGVSSISHSSGSDEVLADKTTFELDCMRNEPYARRGYRFNRADLADYFARQVWYAPKDVDASSIWNDLTPEERSLILRVKAEQQRRQESHYGTDNRELSQPVQSSNDSYAAGSRWQGEHFPQTRQREMSQSEIDSMDYAQLRYSINEAYARHGVSFRKGPIRAQFLRMSWYKPVERRFEETSYDLLTKLERFNVDRLEARLAKLKSN